MPDIKAIDQQRMERAIEEAEAAFYRSLATEFEPEFAGSTRPMTAAMLAAFRQSCRIAGLCWFVSNVYPTTTTTPGQESSNVVTG